MRDWAKLHADISKSRSFAAACNEDPRAGLLFLMMLPCADVLGIVDAHPVIFRGEVCPLLQVTDDELERCLAILQEQDMVVLYDCPKGDRWLWVKHWAKYQGVRWTHVGATTRPLPEGWESPDGLEAFLQEKPRSPLAKRIGELRSNYCRITVALQRPRERARETETEEIQSTETEEQPSAPPAIAEAAREPKKLKGKVGPANTPLAQLVQDTWEALGFAGSPPSKKPAAFSGALRLMDGKADTVRAELIPWINLYDPSPGDGDSEARWFLAFLEQKLKCTPGVGWRKQLAESGADLDLLSKKGWPRKLLKPDMTWRPTPEEVEAMACSPDWAEFPHLDKFMVAPAAEKIRAARKRFEESQGEPS